MTDFYEGGAKVPLLSPVESSELQQVIRNSTGGKNSGAQEQQGCCPMCCTVFSAIGFVVLSLIGAYTLTDSRFIPYETGSGMSRTGQAIQIFVAAGFYAVTFGISLFYVVGSGTLTQTPVCLARSLTHLSTDSSLVPSRPKTPQRARP